VAPGAARQAAAQLPEVPLANRVSLTLPLRVTRDMLGDDGFESWGIGAWGVRAGAGLRFSVVRPVQP